MASLIGTKRLFLLARVLPVWTARFRSERKVVESSGQGTFRTAGSIGLREMNSDDFAMIMHLRIDILIFWARIKQYYVSCPPSLMCSSNPKAV